MDDDQVITISVGQAVAWRHSPNGIAQVEELLRKRVRICYRTKKGTFRHPVIHAAQAVSEQLLFNLHNPFDRAERRGSKVYQTTLNKETA